MFLLMNWFSTGLLARGSYSVKSLFTDDDKNEHLKWEWAFDLKKDWKGDSSPDNE